jgi:putative transposase
MQFLIQDRDTTFPVAFDTVLTAEDVTIMRTPVQAPTTNACAERWLRSVREAWLDTLLIVSARHLERVLSVYIDYYNMHDRTKVSISSVQ